MATYSANTTVKISAAVLSAPASGTGASYTCPANSYAIVQVSLDGGGSSGQSNVTINGNQIARAYANSTAGDSFTGHYHDATYKNELTTLTGIYVGPGQTIAATASGSLKVTITGVEFTNTP